MKKEFLKMKGILRDNGYKLDRKKGSHFIYTKEGKPPVSINKDLNDMVRLRLIKENNLKVSR